MLDSLQNMETTVDVNIVQVFQVNIINQLPSLSAIHLNLFPNIEFDVNMTEVHSWAENEQSWIGKPVDYGDNGDYVILVAM
ncbi:MAG: hypothetical protein H8E64_06880 [Candidatus Marinimicrobia bacterium]|nr:hypothetical protein [Candidatus Neomarinimicrobiota bacterium]